VTKEKPNVVIIIADCLRQDDFQKSVAQSSFLSQLQREAVTFLNCSSVSNWTVPAHVSILTGRYPFEHHVHRLGLRAIPSNLPTIATSLSALGYATQLLSANHNLRPEVGFGTGFDYVAWGSWGETSLRITSDLHPPFDSSTPGRIDLLRNRLLEAEPAGFWKVAAGAAPILPRFPWILDGVSRVHSGLFRKGAKRDYRVAPWLEGVFERFANETPLTRPILSVINLMDCHEPYLPEPGQSDGPSHWLRLVTSRQDVVSYERGRWLPSQHQFDTLRELYRQKVKVIGHRVKRIVNALIASGRWDNTLLVITGDHGQALGEHGQLFHSCELFEPITHVPLWVRYPGHANGGTFAKSQASLVDIYPTVMGCIEPEFRGTWTGIPLTSVLDRIRPDLTISTADGVYNFGSAELSRYHPELSPQVAVFSEDCKLIVDHFSGRTQAYRTADDPSESKNLWPAVANKLRTAFEKARNIGAIMCSFRPIPEESSTVGRLRHWGYLD
jgi:arylsulfatase A-like enzyme